MASISPKLDSFVINDGRILHFLQQTKKKIERA